MSAEEDQSEDRRGTLKSDLIVISPDGLAAAVRLSTLENPPEWAEVSREADRIGIIPERDAKAYTDAVAQKAPSVVIARGQAPKPGYLQACKLVETLDAESKRRGIICVELGETLGYEIKPEKGSVGLDIANNLIPEPEPIPRPDALRPGENTSINPSTGEMIAMINGVFSIADGYVNILDTLEIDGDVDLEVGDVDVNCAVKVNGTVRSGLTLRAEGPVEIREHVEDATVYSSGDVTIGKGVYHRERGSITALGSVTFHHSDNAQIIAGRNIEVVSEALHSNLHALLSIRAVEKKGVIIGGSMTAGHDIEVNVLGSEVNTPTEVRVGFNHTHVAEKIADIHACEELITSVEKLLDPKADVRPVLQLTRKGRSLVDELILSRGCLAARILEIRQEIDRWTASHEPPTEPAHCKVNQTCHRKVMFRIDHLNLTVQTPVTGVDVRPDHDAIEIQVKHFK